MALLSIPLSLVGAVTSYTVHYESETSFHFTKGLDAPGYKSPPNIANKFVGLLGTMYLTVNNPPATLIHPAVLYTNAGSTSFTFTGPRSGSDQRTFTFYIEAVTYINSSTTPSYREPMTQRVVFLTKGNTVSNISSIKVEFYFVSWENSSVFVPGKEYKLVGGVIGNFNLAESSEGNIWNDPDYILLDTQTIDPITNEPTNPVPIIGDGPTTTLPKPMPYVDAEHPLPDYQFFIVNETPISLPNAYGPLKTKVADARVSMLNGQSGETYKIHVNFTSINAQPDKFYLYLDGNHNLYGIPYDLDFEGIPVVPGADIPWEGIPSIGPVERSINVTGINKQNAESAPSGTYQDSIYVNVTSDF